MQFTYFDVERRIMGGNIFIRRMLSYLTKGQIYSAARHRVVNSKSSDDCGMPNEVNRCVAKERVAATLFVRPNGDKLMTTLPSRHVVKIIDTDMVGTNEKEKTL